MSIFGIAPLVVRIFEFPALTYQLGHQRLWLDHLAPARPAHDAHHHRPGRHAGPRCADVHAPRRQPAPFRRRPGQRDVLELRRGGLASDLWLHLLGATAMSASRIPDPSCDLGRPLVRLDDLGRQHAARTNPARCRLPVAAAFSAIVSFAGAALTALSGVASWSWTPRLGVASAPAHTIDFARAVSALSRLPLHLCSCDAGHRLSGVDGMRTIAAITAGLLASGAAHAHELPPNVSGARLDARSLDRPPSDRFRFPVRRRRVCPASGNGSWSCVPDSGRSLPARPAGSR